MSPFLVLALLVFLTRFRSWLVDRCCDCGGRTTWVQEDAYNHRSLAEQATTKAKVLNADGYTGDDPHYQLGLPFTMVAEWHTSMADRIKAMLPPEERQC